MKKNLQKVIGVFGVVVLVVACIGCSTEKEGEKISEKVDGLVTEIADTTDVEKLTETEAPQETIKRMEPIGAVIQESIIMNEDYEYSIEVPESWFGKVSYVIDGSVLKLYHITMDEKAMEINPQILCIDVVEGEELEGPDELLVQGGGYSYVHCPRFDFPYEPNTKDGNEYTLLSADIENILNTFWVNEELLSDEELGNNEENQFAVAGIEDVEYFSQFFYSFQSLISNEFTAEEIAYAVQYPLMVNTENGSIEIKNDKELTENLDIIFTEKVVNAIKTQTFDTLFANYQGVMVGNGEVWFGVTENEEYYILAVNP